MFHSGRYFHNIYKDYETVAVETWADMRANKLKSTAYLTLLAGSGYLIATNPSETDFHEQCTQNTNQLLLVGDPIRNTVSDAHMQNISRWRDEGRLRRFTFALCSIMWVDNFDSCVDLYEAQCKQLKVGWLNWRDRIVDVGVAGRWRGLDRMMIDYDVNPEEWADSEKA